MANVTISDKFLYDRRLDILSELSGWRFYECIGPLIYIFESCKSEKLTKITREQLIQFSPHSGKEFVNAMILAGYFIKIEDNLFEINIKGMK